LKYGGKMDFYTNFKRICDEKNTTPTGVCKALGLSTSKVNLWSNGSLPKQEVMVVLARHLECHVMDFFADDEQAVSISNVEFALDEDEQDIIRLFRMLPRPRKHEFMVKAYEYEKILMGEE
jgi:hypothetical protein